MRKLLIVAALAGAGYGVYHWQAGDEAPAAAATHDETLVTNRVWIDHIPRNERDKIHVFLAITQDRTGRAGPIGVFQKASAWEGQYEGFKFESHGNEMRVVFPQTGERETLKLDAKPCDRGGMDYCLEIAGSKRGATRYYSRKGWEIRGLDEAQAITSQITSAVAR